MKIHNFDENSSLWWKFNTLMEIHRFDENSSLLVKSVHSDEIPLVWWKWKKLLWKWLTLINKVIPLIAIPLIKVLQLKENWSLWWKLMASIKIGYLMKIHHFDEMSSLWWKFVTLEKNSSPHCLIFWKFYILLKNSSILWKMVMLIEDHDSTQMKILMKNHDCNEYIPIW